MGFRAVAESSHRVEVGLRSLASPGTGKLGAPMVGCGEGYSFLAIVFFLSILLYLEGEVLSGQGEALQSHLSPWAWLK